MKLTAGSKLVAITRYMKSTLSLTFIILIFISIFGCGAKDIGRPSDNSLISTVENLMINHASSLPQTCDKISLIQVNLGKQVE